MKNSARKAQRECVGGMRMDSGKWYESILRCIICGWPIVLHMDARIELEGENKFIRYSHVIILLSLKAFKVIGRFCRKFESNVLVTKKVL